MTKRIHLISNAHIDPVWQWEWEEGAAAALSTFRTAADFCEEYGDYVFNHNEALLYQWVEEYEPELFARIQKLVRAGNWHIMGGWYLQPDCNMPSGEGFMRQISVGKAYFQEKFGISPTTAVNFDSFGHSRGLVQILTKNGFDSYIHTRPGPDRLSLPGSVYEWVGYDGSSVAAFRAECYGNGYGQLEGRIRRLIAEFPEDDFTLLLWGMGDHGGGASRPDLEAIARLRKEFPQIELLQSTPEAYFRELKTNGKSLPRHCGDLNPWAPGCYTTQIRIKQKYRQLESWYFMTEKMVAAAYSQNLIPDEGKELEEALHDLLLAQFHDYLTGTSVQPAEEMGIRILDHGLELCSRIRARAFFALARGQKRAEADEIPILIFNPHPYAVEDDFSCEFMLWDQNWSDQFYLPQVFDEMGNALPSQAEQEESHIPIDWRKRVVFHAALAPMQMNRFNCKFTLVQGGRPIAPLRREADCLIFETPRLRVAINCVTGLIDEYRRDGERYTAPGAFCLRVLRDSCDAWGMTVSEFRDYIGTFSLLDEMAGSRLSCLDRPLPSVRVIENADARAVVEALFGYEDSKAVVRYILSKHSTAIDIEVRLYWNEKQKMVKLEIPSLLDAPQCIGQVAYGLENLPGNGRENVSQQFVMLRELQEGETGICPERRTVTGHTRGKGLLLINNGTYGSSVEENALLVTLLRSPGYTGHPLGPDRRVMPDDRFSAYIDQGERLYRFRFEGGPADTLLAAAGRKAQEFHEAPMGLSFFPHGTEGERKPLPGLELDSAPSVVCTAFYRTAEGKYLLRLFNPLDTAQTAVIRIPPLERTDRIQIPPYEFVTREYPAQT